MNFFNFDKKKVIDENARFRGCLIGLATGDAVGTTVEFKKRGTFKPLKDMIGGGPFNLKVGEWTDDTSMALCLGQSLLSLGDFQAKDQMDRYCDWQSKGYMSSNGECFDIGNTVRNSLVKYKQTKNPFSGSISRSAAGNGSLMRLAPVPMFYHNNIKMIIHYSGESSRTTHGATECIEACQLFAIMLNCALSGKNKNDVLSHSEKITFEEKKIIDISQGNYKSKDENEIIGSGYVIDSLEAALWCFYKTENFKDAILKAANLGDDADTTAAICGQIAGAYYGESGIPKKWVKKLAKLNTIRYMADLLHTESQEIKQ